MRPRAGNATSLEQLCRAREECLARSVRASYGMFAEQDSITRDGRFCIREQLPYSSMRHRSRVTNTPRLSSHQGDVRINVDDTVVDINNLELRSALERRSTKVRYQRARSKGTRADRRKFFQPHLLRVLLAPTVSRLTVGGSLHQREPWCARCRCDRFVAIGTAA
jgi:hypothetical protein